MTGVRSDGSILQVDFEQEIPGDQVLLAGLGARIVDQGGFQGPHCVQVTARGGEEAYAWLTPAGNAARAGDGAVLEFVFRPAIQAAVELIDWPIVRCYTRGEGEDQPESVALELRARGAAADGTYEVDVISNKAIVSTAVSGLPQTEWRRFVLHRCAGQVVLSVGPPEEESGIAAYPDLNSEGELYAIVLGNTGQPESQGSGYWDLLRLGWVR